MANLDPHIIDEYLTGHMTKEARISFENQLEQNAELQAALEDRKILLAAIDAIGDVQMKERAKRIHQKATAPVTKVRKFSFLQYAAAAILALVVAVGIWLYLKPASPAELFAAHYEPYVLNFTNRDLNTDQQLSQASTLYINGNYQEAVPLLENLLNQEINNKDQVRLATGIGHMELNNDAAASNYFQQLIDNPSSPYYEQGLWYAALLSLRNENIGNAEQYLNELIKDDTSFYFKKANELLSKLD